MVMNLVPGRGLGPFPIGMVLSDAIQTLKSRFGSYNVNFVYSQAAPLGQDLFLDVPDFGFRLRFEPETQRLRVIHIYNVAKLVLRYHSSNFSGPTTESTFVKVYELFGPTYPGTMDTERGLYFLHYRGITFTFRIPKEFHALYTSTTDMPLELPDGTTPPLERVFVYRGSDLLKPELPPLARHYFEMVVVTRTKSGAAAVKFSGRDSSLRIGSSLQDVLSELGAAAQLYVPVRTKMGIHSMSGSVVGGHTRNTSCGSSGSSDSSDSRIGARRRSGSNTGAEGAGLKPRICQDYFLNYFSVGVDVLMDGTTHTVKKMVLHSNIPGHPEFNNYHKCNFHVRWPSTLPPGEAPGDAVPPPVAPGAGAGVGAGAGAGTGPAPPPPTAPRGGSRRRRGRRSRDTAAVPPPPLPPPAATPPPVTTPAARPPPAGEPHGAEGVADGLTLAEFNVDSTWRAIEAVMGPGGRPMIHGSVTTPFPPSFFYAYDGLIVEVLKGSGHVASVTLFSAGH